MIVRRLIGTLGLATILVFSHTAEARIGYSSHSSYPSHSYSGSSYGSGSRLGGGSAYGMQRPDVANRLRYGNSTAPSYAQQPYYGGMANTQQNRFGWGHMAAAATAGGLAGYLFGHHGGYGYGGGYGGYGGYGGGFGFGSLILFAGLIWFVIYLVRRARNSDMVPRAPYVDQGQTGTWGNPQWSPGQNSGGGAFGSAPGSSYMGGAVWNEDSERIFRDLQQINNQRDEAGLRQFCTAALANELAPNMGGSTQIIALRSEVVDQQDGMVSVRYQGTVMEDGRHPEQVDELWNFVRNPGSGRPWLLAGIQPL